MDVTVSSGQRIFADLEAISSKSFVHRELIAAALSGGRFLIKTNIFSEDMNATAQCLEAMGAVIERSPEGFLVDSPVKEGKSVTLNCKESGSTARFLLPVAACLYDEVILLGEGRLPERPFGPLCDAMRENGVEVNGDHLPIRTKGRLKAGEYRIPGDVSSQFITGLLMALPLFKGNEESILKLTTELSSKEYVDITMKVLSDHGVRILREGDRFRIPQGGYPGPAVGFGTGASEDDAKIPGAGDRIVRAAEGDWSNGGFLLCMGALREGALLTGLSEDSVQGDRAVISALREFGAEVRFGTRIDRNGQNNESKEHREDKKCVTVNPGQLCGIDLDAGNIPDLVPALAVVSAFSEGKTIFRNVGRLRIKESDRIEEILKLLSAIGVRAEASGEGNETALIVHGKGKELSEAGGEITVDAAKDHRIVMAAAIAAAGSGFQITIRGAEAVNKSYPGFFTMCREKFGMEIREESGCHLQ